MIKLFFLRRKMKIKSETEFLALQKKYSLLMEKYCEMEYMKYPIPPELNEWHKTLTEWREENEIS